MTRILTLPSFQASAAAIAFAMSRFRPRAMQAAEEQNLSFVSLVPNIITNKSTDLKGDLGSQQSVNDHGPI